MKMIWFYMIEESQQPFCLTELKPFLKFKQAAMMPESTAARISSSYIKADLAMGFEQGDIKVFDLSNHFQNSKLDEVNKIGFMLPG
jgi:hypothetical protein